VAKRVYVTLYDDPGRARERMNAGFDRIYGGRTERIEAAGVAGTPDGCLDALREVREAGAELILFTPVDDRCEQMELLAAEVMPRL
jgi:alkanesulfonate monooxygenase SsuD/methylene tetrahydromethanopterin reductase-like flavin-dependent oxidoreductase (luciferase family)